MFDLKFADNGEVLLSGRFDATQVDWVREELKKVNTSCTLNMRDLEYISSAGLGVLLGAQKRLSESNAGLTLTNLNKHIREIFEIAGFDRVFKIE